MFLKSTSSIHSWPGSSGAVVTTPIPVGAEYDYLRVSTPGFQDPMVFRSRRPFSDIHNADQSRSPRTFYLARPDKNPPPVISASEFVPREVIAHLMRRKKSRAIAVKYNQGDEITNMEGALHTFVTPIVRIMMHGDYRYTVGSGHGHGVAKFRPSNDGTQRARKVLMSAAIQMDFENREVLLQLCKLGEHSLEGKALEDNFQIISAGEKRDARKRAEYELKLRKHMIANLTATSYLPSEREARYNRLTPRDTLNFLEEYIVTSTDTRVLVGVYFRLRDGRDDTVSLELLFNTALHQLRNEFSALEILAPQGYIYTYDPASIFAKYIGADLLNRITLAALRTLSSSNIFRNMRAFAFNDYADPGAIPLLRSALRRQERVAILPKADLFKWEGGKYDPTFLEGGEEAWLVVHNNSDAFGQNIETEGDGGSMDGALGANSSAAASLERGRADLLRYVF